MPSRVSYDRHPSPLVLSSVLAFALALPGGVRAQDAPVPVDAGEAVAEAPASADPVVRAILVEAVAEYEAGHYAEAQALFRRANELAPSGRTLRGLGMASYELRQYVSAIRSFEAALAARTRPLSDAQRAHVQDLLARASTFVARLAPRIEPEEASLEVDGAPAVREDDGTILLEPGRHVVVLEHEGYERETLDLALEPGVVRELEMRLRPRREREDPPAASPGADLLWGGAGLGIAATVGVAVAATLGAFALVDDARLERDCVVYVCPASAREVRDRANGLSIAADAVGVASAIVGATALALLVAGAIDDRPALEGGAACTQDGCMATLRGVF